MNVPLSLLRKFVDVPLEAQALADLMNGRIAEVEHVLTFGDRQALADVRVGIFQALVAEDGDLQQWQVLAGGAPLTLAVQKRHGFQVNGRYAVVPAGGTAPNGSVVEPRPLGPFPSEGMVLSEATLGIGDDASRPFAFAPDVPGDADVYDTLELDDAILVFDLEPNRPDLFSLVGMARDLAAIFESPLRLPEQVDSNFAPMPSDVLRVEITATDRVHRYAALEVSGIALATSPQWLQNAVRKLGMRPINNVVDAANLAMMEFGQPLHTFDRQTLQTGVIGLRMAEEGETITTLDGVERTLTDECLLVTDGQKGIALAGVMGDLNSEITANSQDLLIESATFDMSCVRRCSRRLSLRTEASLRFEKGLPTCNVLPAMARLAHLLEQVGGSQVTLGRCADVQVREPPPKRLDFSPSEARTRMSIDVDDATLTRRFTTLGITIEDQGETWGLVLPEHRPDLVIQEDLNEEVGRLHGYDQVKGAVPLAPVVGPRQNPLFAQASSLRRALTGAGLDEVCLGAWFGDEEVAAFGLDTKALVSLRNPIASNLFHFRSSALPDLVKAVVLNRKSLDSVRIFEVGRLFFREGQTVEERAHLAGAISGSDNARAPARFYEARDALLGALSALGVTATLVPAEGAPSWFQLHCFHPGRVVGVQADNRLVGIAGELHPALVAATDLQEAPATFHLDLEALLKQAPSDRRFTPPPRFPSVEYHVNVLAPSRLWSSELLAAVNGAKLTWLTRSGVRDVYEGSGVPEGQKRVTVELEFNHPERSLTHDEVLPQVQALKARLATHSLVVEV